jgi:hypothetical protein
MNVLASVFGSLASSVRAINQRYARPSIEMTPFVKFCLLALRLYLFVLVGLMVYKFVITVVG